MPDADHQRHGRDFDEMWSNDGETLAVVNVVTTHVAWTDVRVQGEPISCWELVCPANYRVD